MDFKKKNMDLEIQQILNENILGDLKKFISKRSCLNDANIILIYMFHLIQSAGILTTTIAAGYNIKELIWVGVGLNITASLINIYEKTNSSISKKILKDIISIKNGSYVDEGMMIEGDDKFSSSDETKKSEKKSVPASTPIDSVYNQTDHILL